MGNIGKEEAKRIALEQLLQELGFEIEVVEHAPEDELERYRNDQSRDMYAYYGLAMYFAQVFEHEVVNLLVLARIVRAREKAERILSDPWEARFRDTLGELLRRLKPFVADDQQLLDDLTKAVRVRNRLAHSYWRDRAEDALSLEGRAQMIQELTGIRDMFIDLDSRLQVISKTFRESLGMSDDLISQEFDKARERVRKRDEGFTVP